MSLGIQSFAARPALMRAAADEVATALQAGVAARGNACAALSGGTTPEPAYADLAQRDLDWSKVTFALVDERFVPPSDPGSNEAMLRRALAPALAKGARLEPMWSETGALAAAAAHADARYAPLHVDIALLGMGADAHTASWFPTSPELGAALDPNSPRTVLGVTAPGAAGASERLTLSFAALTRAARLVLLITGADKRARLEAAIGQTSRTAPVAALFQTGRPIAVLWAP